MIDKMTYKTIFLCGLFFFSPLLSIPIHAAEKPFLPTQALTTSRGLTFWMIEDHSQPLITLSFAFSGAGSIHETPDKQGLVRLLSNTLDEGAGPYDSRAFQTELEDHSILLSFSSSRDDFFGTLQTLTETREKAADLVNLALIQPRFDPEPLGRMIEANLVRIRSNQSDPEWLAARLTNDRIFDSHPYALNAGGTLSTLSHITCADLTGFHKNFFTKDRLKIALVGDISQEQGRALIDRIFGSLAEKSETPVPPQPDTPIQNAGKTFLFKKDIPQTIISMTTSAPARHDPDFPAFIVLDNIFGSSGFGSRLMEHIREKEGLTYGIYSNYSVMDHASFLSINASAANENVPRLIDMTHAEMARLKNTPVSKTELDAAKGYLLGSMPVGLTSTKALADFLLSQQLENEPLDGIDRLRKQIRATTIADLSRVAQKWLDPKGIVTVLIGTPTDIKNIQLIEKIRNIE